MKSNKLTIFFIIFACIVFALILYLYNFKGDFVSAKGDLNYTYVSLRFDDGWKSQINAYNSLKKYNMNGSLYIISNYVGKEGYMTWEDVQNVSDVMEIGGHTMDHSDLKNSLDLDHQIGDNYKNLVEKGFNVSTFVFPFGNYNKEAINIVKKYYYCASTQDVGVNNRESDAYLLKDFTLRSDNNLEQVKKVIKNNTWVILTFHDVGNSSENAPSYVKNNAISVQFFEEILKYLKDNNIKVINIRQGCEIIKNQ